MSTPNLIISAEEVDTPVPNDTVVDSDPDSSWISYDSDEVSESSSDSDDDIAFSDNIGYLVLVVVSRLKEYREAHRAHRTGDVHAQRATLKNSTFSYPLNVGPPGKRRRYNIHFEPRELARKVKADTIEVSRSTLEKFIASGEDLGGREACGACMNRLPTVRAEACGHVYFCILCFLQYKSSKCPLCRQNTGFGQAASQ